MARIVPILLVIICAILIACGGGGSGGTGTSSSTTTTATTSTTASTGSTMTPVRLTINWAERSRILNAPSAARSAVVTVFAGVNASTDYKFTIDRNNAPAAYSQNYTSPASVRKGTLLVDIAFFSEPAGLGSVVAAAAADVDFTQNNGDVGDIVVESIIKSVTILPNQSVRVGESKDLLVESRDVDLNIVAISPGSASLSITSGGSFLGVNGPTIVGQASGVGNVVARVNGINSLPVPVNVTGGAATGQGRIYFVSEGPGIKSMSGDGSDLRTVIDGAGVFTSISSPVPNHNQTKLAFAGTKTDSDGTLFTCLPDGASLADLFEGSSQKPDGPFRPRWSLAPAAENNSSTGLDLLWFIAVVPGLGLSSFNVDTLTRTVNPSSVADQLAVSAWTAAVRPLLGLSIATESGWNSSIDGTQIEQEAVGLSQLAISDGRNSSSLWLVAVDASGNLRRYDCSIVDGGSGSVSVSIDRSSVLTTSGGFSNPTISPDGTLIAAERGSFESSEIVVMSALGGSVQSIATGRQPFWR
jgi:hypothetical protein